MHGCVSHIKLNAQVVHRNFNAPRHWIRLSHSIKHYVYSGLGLQEEHNFITSSAIKIHSDTLLCNQNSVCDYEWKKQQSQNTLCEYSHHEDFPHTVDGKEIAKEVKVFSLECL